MAQFVGIRFQVSGFGCQESEVLNPDLPPAETLTPETFSFLQHVVRKKALRA